MRRWLHVTILLVLCVGGCAMYASSSAELEFSSELDSAISRASANDTPIRLDSVADFEWDHVALFGEGATGEEIRGVIGVSVLNGERYTSGPNLLVFLNDGEVVGLFIVTRDLFYRGYGTLFGADVELRKNIDRTSLVDLCEPK